VGEVFYRVATRTYITTPVREVNLSAVVAKANAPIVAQNAVLASQKIPGTPLVLWTNDSYFAARLDDFLDSYGSQYQQDILARAIKAFMSATKVNQTQILSILGLSAYAALAPADLAPILSTIGLTNFLALPPDLQNQCFTLAGLTS
jgi:hypothetical protein